MPDGSESKRCCRCGLEKPRENFAGGKKCKKRDSLCRPCRSAYGKEHYAANRQRYIDKAGDAKRRLALERGAYLIGFFAANPCVDCGERDPVVLEFDHLRDKLFTIGSGLVDRNWQSILDEIAKCEVVCSNCHRRRTALRGGFTRLMLTSDSIGPEWRR